MNWHRTTPPFIVSLIAVLAIAVRDPAAAQNYPTRPVTIVVPFAAGGGNDILARLIAQHMGQALGQQFVIENRAGAGGTIGARAVAKAPPVKCELPPRSSNGAASSISTRAPFSCAEIAAHNAALPAPTTSTSGSSTGNAAALMVFPEWRCPDCVVMG